MIRRLFLVCAMFLSVVSASADESAKANKLLVEAARLTQSLSTNQTLTEQLTILEEALAKLNEIVEKHPSTDLAVKLITGQEIGDISLATLSNAIHTLKRRSADDVQAARREACLESLNATDPKCAMWLGDIVMTHLLAGNPEAALEAAMTTEAGSARDKLFYDIARNHAQTGGLKEALAVVALMEPSDIRLMARRDIDMDLEDIVYERLRAGDLQEALNTAQSIQDDKIRQSVERHLTRAQRQVADEQLRAGNIQDAITTAMQIADSASRNQVLAAVARMQLNAGDLQGALNTTKAMEDSHARNTVLDAVSTTQLLAGDETEALSTAEQIQDPVVRDGFLARVVQRQLQANQLQQASQTAKLMQTISMRDHVWQELARLYTHTQAKDLDKALTYANLIDNDGARDIRLNPIAQAKLRAGDVQAALSLAKSMKTDMRDNVLEEVVKVHTQAGQLADALVVTKLISSENTRHTRLYYITTAQMSANDIQGALDTASRVPVEHGRDELLRQIGNAQVSAGNLQEALSTAKRIEDDHTRDLVLQQIASAQLRAADIQGALSTAESIRSAVYREPMLKRIGVEKQSE